MVVFPEGTRSMTGRMSDFLPSLGYLALRAEVGILPAYIGGAYESLPKGGAIPKHRQLKVMFGPFLSHEFLSTLTAELAQQEAWRLCAAFTQRVVEGLRDGVNVVADAPAVRAAWDGEKLGPISVRSLLERTAGRARRRAGGARGPRT
jgi:1-acyl-sn-glycerol-3-phosphate acyltransferase